MRVNLLPFSFNVTEMQRNRFNITQYISHSYINVLK